MVELKIITRSNLIKSLDPSKIWFFGEEELIKYTAPTVLGNHIGPTIERYLKPFSLNKPFVCELENIELIGVDASGFTDKGELIEETKGFWWSTNRDLEKKEQPITNTYDIVCSLINSCSKCYFHWITECLTKLEGMEHYIKKTGDKPKLLINARPTKWQLESLELLGYNSSDLIEWDDSHVKVNKLILPSGRRFHEKRENDSMSPPMDAFSPSAGLWLRNKIIKEISKKDNKNYPEKIYVSRKNAGHRKISNEKEVMTLLEPLGFVSYTLEKMSFKEQMKLMLNAKFIIGGHGSNLTNIMFSKNAKVIELAGPPYAERPDYFQLSKICNHEYGFINCKYEFPDIKTEEDKDLIVNINKLQKIIKKFVINLVIIRTPADLLFKMPKLIILNIKYGQLGNRLHTFANCIALAKEYGYKIMNLCFEEYQQYFASTQNKPFVCWPEHFVFLKNNFLSKKINTFIYRLFFSNKWCRRLSSFIHVIDIDDLDNIAVDDTRLTEALSSKKTIIIKSWDLRFPELVHKYREDILGYFQPIKEVEKKLDEYFAELRSRYELIIGIHMRGGDYKEFMGGRYHYSVEAYSKIITHLNDVYKSKKVGFLIASNERVEQKDLPNVNIEFGPGSEITDLYALARCDLFLGPPSSFGSWASFYGAVPYYRILDAARLPQPEDFKVKETLC